MVVTPQLRANVACLGQLYCYPLAFGVPAVLMFIAIAAFLVGRLLNMYVSILCIAQVRSLYSMNIN